MRPVVLIDAKNLLFRSHFAHEALRDSEARSTGAIYGFLASYRAIRKDFPLSRFVICWEGGVLGDDSKQVRDEFHVSWRKGIFPEYKNNRKSGNDRYLEALKQIPVIVEMMELIGSEQIEIAGLEADDLISIMAHMHGNSVVVYSNDADLLQLLSNDNVKVARPSKERYEFMTRTEVFKKYGVTPEDWAKYRALCGDPSDNIKVLHGIGPEKAKKMLADGVDASIPQFESLPAKVREKYPTLKAQWEPLHAAWKISALPTGTQFLRVAEWQRKLIDDVLRSKLSGPVYTGNQHERCKRFLQICSDYDMRNFIGWVGNFFPLS